MDFKHNFIQCNILISETSPKCNICWYLKGCSCYIPQTGLEYFYNHLPRVRHLSFLSDGGLASAQHQAASKQPGSQWDKQISPQLHQTHLKVNDPNTHNLNTAQSIFVLIPHSNDVHLDSDINHAMCNDSQKNKERICFPNFWFHKLCVVVSKGL